MEPIKYLNALNQIKQIGPARMKILYDYFSDFQNAWHSDVSELEQSGIGKNLAEAIAKERKKIDPDLEMEKLIRQEIKPISVFDKNYPSLLKEIYNAPFIIYAKGELLKPGDIPLAVVGTRKFTSYGKEVSEKIISEIASLNKNFNIISGLAFGIDSIAHQSALSNNLKTTAVLGSGLSNIFPKSNERLAKQIIEKEGCLISEFPPNYPPLKENFPQRNRIISGLSLGVLVVEAPKKSGTLITAGFALEQGRDVFAVPGSIFFPNSQGSNFLIKEGAIPTESGEDVLRGLNIETTNSEGAPGHLLENENEKILFETLSCACLSADELKEKLNIDIKTINATLSILELKGVIKNVGEKWAPLKK